MATFCRDGSDSCIAVVTVGARPGDLTQGGIIHVKNKQILVGGELGGQGGVAGDKKCAGILGVAIAPLVEMVTHGRDSHQCCRSEVRIIAAATDCTHQGTICAEGDRIDIGCEEGLERAVLGNEDLSRIG